MLTPLFPKEGERSDPMGTRNTFSHVPFPSQLVLRVRLRGWLRRGELGVGVLGKACQIVAGSSCTCEGLALRRSEERDGSY